MKTLEVPFIDGLEGMTYDQLDLAMETGAAKSFIGEVCWPGQFPYHPDAAFAVARSRTHLAVLYHIRCLDLRAEALEDNGPVWEDSCCEFFASDPSDGTYYNFEMNCIGTLLGAKRRTREECTHYSCHQALHPGKEAERPAGQDIRLERSNGDTFLHDRHRPGEPTVLNKGQLLQMRRQERTSAFPCMEQGGNRQARFPQARIFRGTQILKYSNRITITET